MARGVRALEALAEQELCPTRKWCGALAHCLLHSQRDEMNQLQTPTVAWMVLALGTLLSCAPATPARTETAPPDQAASATFASPVASRSSSAQLALDVPGFLPAVLVMPSGTAARPLVVAAHGAGGAPEWDCEYWAHLTEGQAFVLCPRGTAMGSGSFYFKQHHALGAEVQAA